MMANKRENEGLGEDTMNANGKCEFDLDLISALIDGELREEEEAQVHRHLGVCASCREAYTELESVSLSFNGLPQVHLPASLVREVRREVASKTTAPKEAGWFVFLRSFLEIRNAWSYSAAGALALLLLCLFVLRTPVSPPAPSHVALAASADEEIAALDLVITYDSKTIDLGEASLAAKMGDFMIVSHIENGTLRVSMASPKSVRLTGSDSVLVVPVNVNNGDPRKTGILRVDVARAYRADGKPVSVSFQETPTLPEADGDLDTTA
jgi:hypothetical protein